MKKYETLGIPVLSIYDFNRKDKSLDIIIQSDEEDGNVSTDISKYNKGKIKNYEYFGYLDSFNSNTGIIKMVSYGSFSLYRNRYDIRIGEELISRKIRYSRLIK